MLEWLHPMRTSRYLASAAFNPWMHSVAELARLIEKRRAPLPESSLIIAAERSAIELVFNLIESAGKLRDTIKRLTPLVEQLLNSSRWRRQLRRTDRQQTDLYQHPPTNITTTPGREIASIRATREPSR
jgi:hypothetical protein